MLYCVTVNIQKHRAVHASGQTGQKELYCNIWLIKFHVNSETSGIKEENGEENELKQRATLQGTVSPLQVLPPQI